MNILPKKRWHVRTKENIARVRKDEAEAAEKDRQEKLRIANAEREARLNTLKQKSKQKLIQLDIQPQNSVQYQEPQEHINLFSDIDNAVQTTNKEHDREIKEKREDYEKKIGYLTYLGQDTNETLGKKNWYELPPESTRFSRPSYVKDTYDKLVLKDEDGKPKKMELDEKDGEIGWKSKQRIDPLNSFKKYCNDKKYPTQKYAGNIKDNLKNTNKKKESNNRYSNKEKTNNKDDSAAKLQKLREARLKREQQEKYRTEMFLSKLSGEVPENEETDKIKKVKPKYNSQFNPELARQNYQ
ncbi:unnamed protein product, partial [Brenthis ino]